MSLLNYLVCVTNSVGGAWECSSAITRGPGTAFPRVPPYFNHCSLPCDRTSVTCKLSA